MDGSNGSKSEQDFDLWYVVTGAVGSMCFVVGGVLEGEHNRYCMRAVCCDVCCVLYLIVS